jgi:hypothetical protein
MPVLTNFADHCDLLNLGFAPGGKGPYAVRQTGAAPGSMTLQQDSFLLRKDGAWVINLTVFSLPEKEIRDQFLFGDVSELITMLDGLSGKPLVVEDKIPADKSREEILAALKTAAAGLISRIRDAQASKVER